MKVGITTAAAINQGLGLEERAANGILSAAAVIAR
jgi:hypothetical protein